MEIHDQLDRLEKKMEEITQEISELAAKNENGSQKQSELNDITEKWRKTLLKLLKEWGGKRVR